MDNWITDIAHGVRVLKRHNFTSRTRFEYVFYRLAKLITEAWENMPKPTITQQFTLYFEPRYFFIGVRYGECSETVHIQPLPMIGVRFYKFSLINWFRYTAKGSHCATCGRHWFWTCKRDCIPF